MGKCPACSGVGSTIHAKGHDVPCDACGGTGSNWVRNLSPDGHTCDLFDYYTYSDTPLTLDLLESLKDRIQATMIKAHESSAKEHWDMNIGIYNAGSDVRCWPVHHVSD